MIRASTCPRLLTVNRLRPHAHFPRPNSKKVHYLISNLLYQRKMKSYSAVIVGVLALICSSNAFSVGSSFAGSQVAAGAANSAGITMEYIPSGMSKEQWQKMKNAEKNKNKGKNLGASGITTFKSRSFSDWQKAGGKNLFPVDPRKVKDPKDLPYM